MSDTHDKTTPSKPGAAVRVLYLAFIAVVLFFDQLSKWMVTELIMRKAEGGTPIDPITWISSMPEKLPYHAFEITPFYNIVMVWNYGISFGMFNSQSPENAFILVGIAVVISFGLLLWMLDTKSKYVGLALAMAIGGAFGNIVDRMRFGAVIDFIDIHVAGYHWPAFNVADSCIVVGILFVILHSLFCEKTDTKNKKDSNINA